MQDAVILFVQIVGLGSELFSEVKFNRLILSELNKFGFKSSDTNAITTSSGEEFQGFTTLTAKLFFLILKRDGNVASFSE